MLVLAHSVEAYQLLVTYAKTFNCHVYYALALPASWLFHLWIVQADLIPVSAYIFP